MLTGSHHKLPLPSQMAMATPLPQSPPAATAAWPDRRHGRPAAHLYGDSVSTTAPSFSVQLKKSSTAHLLRSFAPLSAAPASSGSTSILTSEGLTNPLETVEVFDLTGKSLPITNIWRDRKAVVAFARHFGCVLCRKRADLLASKKDLMDAAGVALILIGPGSVDQARAFSEQTKFKGEVYADPNHSSYEAFQFVYGISTTFTPSAGLKIVQSYLEGYRQDWGLSFKKDTMTKGGWQQGGILVAGPGITNISYIHKDKEAGDDPDIQDVVKACCS